MCGRYTLEDGISNEAFSQICQTISDSMPGVRLPTGEITPSWSVPVLIAPGTPALQSWGFPRSDGRGLIINARAETADTKPIFRQSLLHRRCAIPCTGFFEWDQNKRKYHFTLPEHKLFYLAGIYNLFSGQAHFVILTTQANPSMADIHDRMPIILDDNTVAQWLNDPEAALRILRQEPPFLTRKSDSPEQMTLW